ncbi:hypothetical protein [Bacillus sp. FJAT-44742]|uniref:hypothetical protein n=1 Tax=Bacillus sp. FJAT-44742 TaxID=2014005 RepID=UPI000C230E1F|nr:hypothetical protein [Bacillus sp. FJAT-44742]
MAVEKVYHATESRPLWLFLFVLTVWYAFYFEFQIPVLPYLLPLLPVYFLLVTYELQVEEDIIRIKTKVFNFTIKEKTAEPENIKEMVILYMKWAQKGVLIRLHKGMRWRVIQYTPTDYDEALKQFARSHQVPVMIHGDPPNQ